MLVPMWRHKELPLVRCVVEHEGQSIELDALVDTGSAGTMLKTEIAESLGIHYMQAESIMAVYGIGGRETIYTHDLNRLIIGDRAAINFYVEVGEMDYGLQTASKVMPSTKPLRTRCTYSWFQRVVPSTSFGS